MQSDNVTSSITLPASYRKWVVSGATGAPDLKKEHFRQVECEIPSLMDGEALIRVKMINVHSATRLRILRGMIATGQTDLNNYACAEVVSSRDPAFCVGDVIACQAGWQEYQVISSRDLPVGFAEPNNLVKALNGTHSPWVYVFRPAMVQMWPASTLMEIFGTSGMTAWFGLQQNGPMLTRDTVAVAATTGSVGSIVAQIAKAAGCRVVGFAGGAERCTWVTTTLGIDDCIDYTSPDLDKALRKVFPEGIDLFSDGVGGDLTERVTRLMNRHSRLFSYGSAASYYAPSIGSAPEVRPTMRQNFGITEEVERRLSERHIRSHVWTVDQFYHQRLQAEDALSQLLLSGQLKPNSHTVDGFEHLPAAITGMYRSRQPGKLQIAFK
ncbi:MDR family NADP-dependent oxidoreductase [Pantoea cypripedii]|uniref:NADP-dependent oxidoreductase n=1 Tax=Pantoea cypripedii TaxID=55209 RepID=A0A6B9G5V9_PANCY|nr:NADP-dependent oxidoreductase [Pantoea cypripedii]QGY32448.1 hypothetical protein CUN67_26105 [Pantoea cypripedii]